MDINQFVEEQSRVCTVPDRLRWTSDFLDLANKAIAIIACAQGLDLPPGMYLSARDDLRAWARYLDDRPSVVEDFELARIDPVYQYPNH